MLFPLLFLLSYFLVIPIVISLYRSTKRRFPSKLKYAIPVLSMLFLWPINAMTWLLDSSNRNGTLHKGIWYTFSLDNDINGSNLLIIIKYFILPIFLALVDVLILGAFFWIPIFLISRTWRLLRRQ